MVELLKAEPRILRIPKRGDDATEVFGREVGFETDLCHAAHQCFMICEITSVASSDAAFHLEFKQSLMESKQRMRGRRKAKLPVGFESRPLRMQIKAECARPAVCFDQPAMPRQYESETRNSFNAFVRGGDKKIDARGSQVQSDCPKAAHGIHDVCGARSGYGFADLYDWIDNSCGGFAVHNCNMSSIIRRRQALRNSFR